MPTEALCSFLSRLTSVESVVDSLVGYSLGSVTFLKILSYHLISKIMVWPDALMDRKYECAFEL